MSYPSTKLDRAVARAIAAENEDPQGLPADILASMERTILENRDKYPAAAAALENCRQNP